MKKFKRIYVEITNRCNLNCSFCGNTKRALKEMSLEEFSLILQKIKPYTDHIYLHVKGEPLLHSHLEGILDLCIKNHLLVNLTTNGVLLKRYENLFLRSSCLRQINVSLHCEQELPNYFEDVFSTCQKLSSRIYISYRLWTLPHGKIDAKAQTIIDEICSFYKLSPSVVEKILNDKNVKIDHNTYVSKENLFTWPDTDLHLNVDGYCHALSQQIAILVDGTIVPCCLDGEGDIKLGNIFEDDLGDVLQGERFLNMLNGFRNNRVVEKLCANCDFKNRFNHKRVL